MLDVRRLRTDLEATKAALARKGVDATVLDVAAALDARVRDLATKRDDMRGRIKALSKEVGQAHRHGEEDKAEALATESRTLGEEERTLAAEAEAAEARLREILLTTANTPSPDAPEGLTADDNVVVRTVGYDTATYAAHQRVPHWDIGADLGILDLERGAKLSGSMFVMFRKQGATLARALCQLALDRNADAFEEIRPPTLVRTETMVSTGHLPKFEEEAYHLERDDLWAIPTAEVPLTSLARDEILDEADLPMRVMAYTPCFRREAGSAGRDTRGLLRVHEFDKVEILALCTEAQAHALHEELVDRATGTLAALGLAYRVVDLAAGDLSFSAARCFDIEIYAPGCDLWLEASSVSWFGDFQARRANLRYRPQAGGGTTMAHTLNGSALAVPRVWAALVETHRRPDGTVRIPDALRPYMRGAEVIGPS
ncbi:MAG TPA: serine--tRNA ligase [Acidimicrobiales bacterium]|nr:serine--tRNA ligase [Acidimicrobiales bacterium]